MTLPALHAPLLSRVPGVRHAFFTRKGGFSQGLYASLNAGAGSDDDPGRVRANRARVAEAIGVGAGALLTAYQIHSAEIVVCQGPFAAAPPRADGLATQGCDLALAVLTADCAPVLIAEPRAGLVAAVHAGWRGALAGIVGRAVSTLELLGGRPADMVAAVGPCIGPTSYEVGAEFEARFLAASADYGRFFFQAPAPDKRRFDLPGFVLSRLRSVGVEAAEWIGRDTLTEEADFYSNRRAVLLGERDYGRLISAIRLEG